MVLADVLRVSILIAVATLGLTAGAPALARQSYCCNDANGKLVCGDMLPAVCQNRAYRIKDEKGRLVHEVEAPLTPEQRALREVEKARKLEEDKRLAEQKRRDQAMLATYPHERDIDAARDRSMAEFEKASGDTKKRLDAAIKRKKALDAEKEFYVKKPMPANLKKQVEETDHELKTLQEAVDNRTREGDALRARFEEEKKRYMELRYGKTNRQADVPVPAPSVPVSSTARVQRGTGSGAAAAPAPR